MKKILFIDCETSGLPDFNKRTRDPAQPHIVQFAAIQMDDAGTMKMLTNICKLPGRFAGSYKWPKLSEAYQHAFGETLENAHNALVDIQATARLYFWMIQQGIVTENGTVAPR